MIHLLQTKTADTAHTWIFTSVTRPGLGMRLSIAHIYFLHQFTLNTTHHSTSTSLVLWNKAQSATWTTHTCTRALVNCLPHLQLVVHVIIWVSEDTLSTCEDTCCKTMTRYDECWELNPGHQAWAVSAQPLSYNHQATSSFLTIKSLIHSNCSIFHYPLINPLNPFLAEARCSKAVRHCVIETWQL